MSGPPPKLRILVVDDDRDLLQVLDRLLKNVGHEVWLAGGCQEAVQIAGGKKFDVLISDIGLSDGTGLELIRELTGSGPFRSVALTGFGMPGDIAQSRAAGYNVHLTKPVTFDKLIQAIKEASNEE